MCPCLICIIMEASGVLEPSNRGEARALCLFVRIIFRSTQFDVAYLWHGVPLVFYCFSQFLTSSPRSPTYLAQPGPFLQQQSFFELYYATSFLF